MTFLKAALLGPAFKGSCGLAAHLVLEGSGAGTTTIPGCPQDENPAGQAAEVTFIRHFGGRQCWAAVATLRLGPQESHALSPNRPHALTLHTFLIR